MITPQLLSDIHAQFRRRMNADIVGLLRTRGVSYKLAFGVPSMQLRDVAALCEPSSELAEALWGEDIRESKMLATRLYPVGEFSRGTALRWVEQSPYDEVSDQLVMNLLAHVTYAPELLMPLVSSDSRRAQYTALKLATRLRSTLLLDPAAAILRDTSRDMALRVAANIYLS